MGLAQFAAAAHLSFLHRGRSNDWFLLTPALPKGEGETLATFRPGAVLPPFGHASLQTERGVETRAPERPEAAV